ncbi:MAG: hypothetical protein M1476_04095 [Candidatus Thermoplasmatota archaeon]|nr:hypothetical protein [Candidatus Thermoplasmatota archaeon]
MDNKQIILRYLHDTFSIRNLTEQFTPLNRNEPGAGASVLAPWSVDAVRINCDVDRDDVLNAVENIDSLEVQRVTAGTEPLDIIVSGSEIFPVDVQVENVRLKREMEISKIMNLHAFQFLLKIIPGADRPVKIEDAIFDLKNNVFLPDDFMPENLMGMVEGDFNGVISQVRDSMQFLSDSTALYIFTERKGDGFGRVRYLYPSRSLKIENLPDNERLRSVIMSQFAIVQREEKFKNFETGRVLKNVLYNMEQKKTRELKKPVFDSRKMELLDSFGLITSTDGVFRVKDEISTEYLRQLQDEAKRMGHELAESWLKKEVSIEG